MSALMARVARLDHERVYWGLSDPAALSTLKAGDFVFGAPELAKTLPAGVVYVERDCDLPGGRYRLEAPNAHNATWHFAPLEPQHVKRALTGPNLEQAFHDFLRKGKQGAVVQAWLKFYEKEGG
jgi:hypothetical protein